MHFQSIHLTQTQLWWDRWLWIFFALFQSFWTANVIVFGIIPCCILPTFLKAFYFPLSPCWAYLAIEATTFLFHHFLIYSSCILHIPTHHHIHVHNGGSNTGIQSTSKLASMISALIFLPSSLLPRLCSPKCIENAHECNPTCRIPQPIQCLWKVSCDSGFMSSPWRLGSPWLRVRVRTFRSHNPLSLSLSRLAVYSLPFLNFSRRRAAACFWWVACLFVCNRAKKRLLRFFGIDLGNGCSSMPLSSICCSFPFSEVCKRIKCRPFSSFCESITNVQQVL